MDFGGCCKLRVHVGMLAPLHVCVADMYARLLPLAMFDKVPSLQSYCPALQPSVDSRVF